MERRVWFRKWHPNAMRVCLPIAALAGLVQACGGDGADVGGGCDRNGSASS